MGRTSGFVSFDGGVRQRNPGTRVDPRSKSQRDLSRARGEIADLRRALRAAKKDNAMLTRKLDGQHRKTDVERQRLASAMTVLAAYGVGATKRSSSKVLRRQVAQMDVVCRWCMSAPATTADHIVPLSLGGRNTALNMVGSCSSCNEAKSDILPKHLGWTLHLPLRFFQYTTDDPERGTS